MRLIYKHSVEAFFLTLLLQEVKFPFFYFLVNVFIFWSTFFFFFFVFFVFLSIINCLLLDVAICDQECVVETK